MSGFGRTSSCANSSNSYSHINYEKSEESRITSVRRAFRDVLNYLATFRGLHIAISTFEDRINNTWTTFPITEIAHELCTIDDFFEKIRLEPGGGTSYRGPIEIALKSESTTKMIFISDGEGEPFSQICTPDNKHVFQHGIIIGPVNETVVGHLCEEVTYCSTVQEVKDKILLLCANVTITNTCTIELPSHVKITHPCAKLVEVSNGTGTYMHTISSQILKLESKIDESEVRHSDVHFIIDTSGSMGCSSDSGMVHRPSANPLPHSSTAISDIINDVTNVPDEEKTGTHIYEITLSSSEPTYLYLENFTTGDRASVDGIDAVTVPDEFHPIVVEMFQFRNKLFQILHVLQTTDDRQTWKKFVKEAVSFVRDSKFVDFVKNLEQSLDGASFQKEYLEFTTLICNLIELEKQTKTVADVEILRLTAVDLTSSRRLTAQAMRFKSGPDSGRQASNMLDTGSLPIIAEDDDEECFEDEDGRMKCMTCLDEPAMVMNVPCGHVAMCQNCTPATICGFDALNEPYTCSTGNTTQTHKCMICRTEIEALVYLEEDTGKCLCGRDALIVSLDCKHKAFCIKCHHENLRAKRSGNEIPNQCACGIPCTMTIQAYL